MSGEAILSAENSGKLLGGRASQLALPQTPYIAGGIKVAAPPKEPHLRSQPSVLADQWKTLDTQGALGLLAVRFISNDYKPVS